MENPQKKEIRLKRNKEIIKLYPALTLKEIAVKYGISVEAVRQVIKKNGPRK